MDRAAEIYSRAIDLLKNGLLKQGYIASLDNLANYNRLWARDSIITGLSALLTDDRELIEGMKNTLMSLKQHQHTNGMIPSNLSLDTKGNITAVSFGTLTGKVDTVLWFVIGVLIYYRKTGDQDFIKEMQSSVEKAFHLLLSWEFNDRGLLYIPQGGNWADEFILEGYNLSEQLLYYWALNEAVIIHEDYLTKAKKLKEIIKINYWPAESNRQAAYHKTAFERQIKREVHYWLPGFRPAGYYSFFDCFAQALSFLLAINSSYQQKEIVNSMNQILSETVGSLLPSFWPVIREKDTQWVSLQNNWRYEFRNRPGAYQNGGVWPVFNGLLIAGLYRSGQQAMAGKQKEALYQAVTLPEQQFGFYEYIDAFSREPGGSKYQLWSAAGVIFAEKATQNIFLV